jgi:succinate dehydrogenase / fumarate reductase, membrane anchor subunit
MVKSVTGLTGSGVKDFIIQRLTAYILFFYLVWLVVYCAMHAPMDYTAWHQLFSLRSVKALTLLSMFSLILHAWVGVWTVLTDYIHCAWIRGSLMLATFCAFLVYLAWIIQILWG